MRQRDYSLDYIKAFAIFLVVVDHLIRKLDSQDNPVITFIYSCHMPLFFMVSGILASKKLGGISDVLRFWVKKTRLIIPVVVFGLGNVLLLNQDIGEFLIWHKFGLWFLWTLFIFFTIYALSQLCLLRNKNRIVEICGIGLPALVCIALRQYQDTAWGG